MRHPKPPPLVVECYFVQENEDERYPIAGNTIVSNTASEDGGGIYFDYTLRSVHSNTIYGNVSNGTANDIYVEPEEPDVNAQSNWWNTTNLTEIEARIYHFTDDNDLALVDFEPFLSAAPSSSTTVAPNGGPVQCNDGAVDLTFPANAVSESVEVSCTSLQAPSQTIPAAGYVLRSFNFRAITTNDNQPISQFQNPISLIISYTDAELAAQNLIEESLNVAYLNGNNWEMLLPCNGCSRDTQNNRLIIQLDHFSEFSVIGSDSVPLFLPVIQK